VNDETPYGVAAEAADTIADGQFRSLDPRIIPLERLEGWIATGCVSAGVLLGILILGVASNAPAWVASGLSVLWLILTLGLIWHTLRWPELAFRHTSYKIDALGIEIRRGVIWRIVINIPRSRVQHIDVSQGPIERRFGLGTLTIYTAGTAHAMVALQGLAHPTALAVRNHLLPERADDAV
jgi:membrane protein YdbS with pleckstrin-like domain